MNEFGNMIKIGELADKKMADEIVTALIRKNIHLTKIYDEKSRAYVLYASDEESAIKAFEYYRVKVGLAPPPKPMPKEWNEIKRIPLGSITLVFLGVSLFVFVSKFFLEDTLYKLFFISNFQDQFLYEISRGEVWRLFTPVFLHFNFMHIFFNGMWMKDLGSLIESFKGKTYYLCLLAASGILSNLGQYFVKGPFFGGLSGIVYGLLGFIWMNKKFDSEAAYALPKNDIIMMIGWFFLCFTGLIGPIANTAHGIGLGVGMIFGIVSGSLSSKIWDYPKASLYGLFAVIFGAGTFAFEYFVMPMISNS